MATAAAWAACAREGNGGRRGRKAAWRRGRQWRQGKGAGVARGPPGRRETAAGGRCTAWAMVSLARARTAASLERRITLLAQQLHYHAAGQLLSHEAVTLAHGAVPLQGDGLGRGREVVLGQALHSLQLAWGRRLRDNGSGASATMAEAISLMPLLR